MEQLKKCPFCGSKSVRLAENTLEGHFIGYSVHCNGCGVENRCTKDKEEAVNAWNSRTEPSLKIADVERVLNTATVFVSGAHLGTKRGKRLTIREFLNNASKLQRVVRCKECKHRNESKECSLHSDDYFCAFGEIKDGEQHDN